VTPAQKNHEHMSTSCFPDVTRTLFRPALSCRFAPPGNFAFEWAGLRHPRALSVLPLRPNYKLTSSPRTTSRGHRQNHQMEQPNYGIYHLSPERRSDLQELTDSLAEFGGWSEKDPVTTMARRPFSQTVTGWRSRRRVGYGAFFCGNFSGLISTGTRCSIIPPPAWCRMGEAPAIFDLCLSSAAVSAAPTFQ